MDRGNALSLQLCYKYWSETVVLGLLSSRETIQNVQVCTSTFVELYNGETDNNDNSSRENSNK